MQTKPSLLCKKRRTYSSLAFLCLLISSVLNPAVANPSIEGLWLVASGDAVVNISSSDGIYRGQIVGSPTAVDDFSKALDDNNPDPALRHRTISGLEILSGFSYKDGIWSGGRIYDPHNGKTYKCNLTIGENSTLDVRGYVGIALFGRSETWLRFTGTLHK